MITKRVKRNIVGSHCLLVLFWMCVLTLFLWLILLKTNQTQYIWYVVSGSVGITCILEVVAYVHALSVYRKWLNRVKDTNMDVTHFTMIDNHYSVSSDWLVYHTGNVYIPFLKNNIDTIQYDGHRLMIQEKGVDSAYVYKATSIVYHALQKWAAK